MQIKDYRWDVNDVGLAGPPTEKSLFRHWGCVCAGRRPRAWNDMDLRGLARMCRKPRRSTQIRQPCGISVRLHAQKIDFNRATSYTGDFVKNPLKFLCMIPLRDSLASSSIRLSNFYPSTEYSDWENPSPAPTIGENWTVEWKLSNWNSIRWPEVIDLPLLLFTSIIACSPTKCHYNLIKIDCSHG
jgi:hypothetical protein